MQEGPRCDEEHDEEHVCDHGRGGQGVALWERGCVEGVAQGGVARDGGRVGQQQVARGRALGLEDGIGSEGNDIDVVKIQHAFRGETEGGAVGAVGGGLARKVPDGPLVHGVRDAGRPRVFKMQREDRGSTWHAVVAEEDEELRRDGVLSSWWARGVFEVTANC